MTAKWLSLTPNPPCIPVFYTLTKVQEKIPVGRPIVDLFSFHVLFSHFRPRDATRDVSFKCRLMHAQIYPRLMEKTKGKFPWGHHVEMGKQNVQAKEVCRYL